MDSETAADPIPADDDPRRRANPTPPRPSRASWPAGMSLRRR